MAKKHRKDLQSENPPMGRDCNDRQFVPTTRDRHTDGGRNYKEAAIIDAIDHRDEIRKFTKLVNKLNSGKMDVTNFFAGMAPDMVRELAMIALSPKSAERTRLAAITEMLDRAGYSKVQKHAVIGSLDASASKQELLGSIMGAMKGAGDIEIIDDEQEDSDQEESIEEFE